MRRVQADGGESGMTLIFLAMSVVVFLGLTALAVDLGRLFVLRTQLQNAADAAALAGAFTLIDINQPQPASAANAAITIAKYTNTIAGPVTLTSSNVSVDTVNRIVTVTAPQPATSGVLYAFANAAGVKVAAISAVAKARAGSGAAERSLKPVFVPNSLIRASSDSTTTACSTTAPHTIFYPANSSHYGEITPYAQTYLPSNANAEVPIRPTKPSSAPAPSEFYSIDFGGGASTYSDIIAHSLAYAGITEPVGCGNSLSLKTGNMVGPTISGFNAMIGSPADSWEGPGKYEDSNGVIHDTSRSLMVAPVFDDCTQSNLKSPLKVIGYVDVFVDKVDQSEGGVYGHVVTATGCAGTGSGTGVPSTPMGTTEPTGAYGAVLQLVQ